MEQGNVALGTPKEHNVWPILHTCHIPLNHCTSGHERVPIVSLAVRASALSIMVLQLQKTLSEAFRVGTTGEQKLQTH